MTESARPIANMTFRETMTELEGIVAQLESGSLELEESLERYARGTALLASLQERLGAAEQRVEVLMGELSAAPEDQVQDTTLSKA